MSEDEIYPSQFRSNIRLQRFNANKNKPDLNAVNDKQTVTLRSYTRQDSLQKRRDPTSQDSSVVFTLEELTSTMKSFNNLSDEALIQVLSVLDSTFKSLALYLPSDLF